MEIRRYVQPIQVSLLCDKCNKGTMTPNGGTHQEPWSSEILYFHICGECFHSEYFDKQYPYIEYQELRAGPAVGYSGNGHTILCGDNK